MASQMSWRKPDTGRSRSGCANCKAKHVKCDEAKPNCKACLSRGDTCSGYLKVFRWSNKHEKLPKGDWMQPLPDWNTNFFGLSDNAVWETSISQPSIDEQFRDVQWCTDSSGFANAADGSFSTNVLGGVEGLNIFDNLSRGSSDLGLSPPRLEDTGVPPPSYMFQHLSLSTGSTSSEAVTISLENMPEAHLSSKVPHMRQTSVSLMKSATRIIKAELVSFQHSNEFTSVPTGLLFALLCISTSVCWLYPDHLGNLREAKGLLHQINRQKRSLCEKDFKLLHAFNKSWTYYDMLLSVAAGNGPRGTSEMESVDDISADGYSTAEQTQLDIDQESPHPWTGVSTTISRLFTRTMKVCHNFHFNVKQHSTITAHNLTTALKLIKEAKAIEERLIHLDFETSQPVTQRLPSSILTGQGNTGTAGDELVIPLGLRLVKILKQLPPDSGSRMTQPLLCITASIGPRFTSSSATPTIEACDMSDYINYLCRVDKDTEQLSSVTRSELEIDNARQFLLCRLNALEMALPPWPVVVARNLVKSIWNAYDRDISSVDGLDKC
ncbi:hypothetical protein FOXB_17433 [Fusarium oxysporum f. sp. conglutinans Fo5176]|uniref:Zn(2)-C6 fungal-type domain-containing protein n=1 Tax=Fusarium oxysporum (strain Fo5176) TaxID=660025 RepID=F9GFJ9_FUSOF|nr:hypothetical protein FOXB_17433 [Fusarium oxysporum f. sp. conglutinans Fo5176]